MYKCFSLITKRSVLPCILAFLLFSSPCLSADEIEESIEYNTGPYAQIRGSYQYIQKSKLNADEYFADTSIGYLFSSRWEAELGYTQIDSEINDDNNIKEIESDLVYQSFNYKYPANNHLTLYTKFGWNYAESTFNKSQCNTNCKESEDYGALFGFGFYFKLNDWSAMVFDYGIHKNDQFVLDALSIGFRFGTN